ncbi:MAG: bifunctional glutamate N-acetyltransferase/amino-acid acetyltransferase ArgJ [Rhizobiaceae bacterium]
MHAEKVSPLAPDKFAELPQIEGVRLNAAEAGIKYTGRKDLAVLCFDEGTALAGVFTQSKCPSAPVDLCRRNLSGGSARLLVINSGNANAFTGVKGEQSVSETASAGANIIGCTPSEIFAASTGVIGEPLDASKITGRLPQMIAEARADGWRPVAEAMMTTDTFPKLATVSTELDGITVTINGIAKGAGMIAPDMATMLAFVVTDVPIEANVLQSLLNETAAGSFNSITVDTDTSTSDTLLAFATGTAGTRGVKSLADVSDPRIGSVREALFSVLKDLALQVVSDGEGASKLIEVTVTGADSSVSAKRIALSVANSPLVKTAVAGEDANWGRVVMAIGKAGEPADRDKLSIWFGDNRLAHLGERDPDYDEDIASAYMQQDKIVIRADVGVGDGQATVWGCDLTKEYVAINGDYRS